MKNKIEIDFKILISKKLSPTEYTILYLLYNKRIDILDEFCINGFFSWTNDDNFLSVILHLEKESWLKVTEYIDFNFNHIVLRQKAINLFEKVESKEDLENQYLKLYNTFPAKVPDGSGGYRILRSIDTDSEDYKAGLPLYLKLVKKDTPETILKALENQLKINRNKLQYTNNILTWLRQKVYQKYIDIESSNQDKVESV